MLRYSYEPLANHIPAPARPNRNGIEEKLSFKLLMDRQVEEQHSNGRLLNAKQVLADHSSCKLGFTS